MSLSKNFIKDWIFPIAIAMVLFIVVYFFVGFRVKVPSPSMDPTIKVGDNLIVTRIYSPNSIKRGDILVFDSKETNKLLIKRVIGLPGDSIEIKPDGKVFVNNKEIEENYVKHPGGKSGTFKVPEDEYFFLGDNRDNSYDGRYWKNSYIPFGDIKAKAILTIYPFDRIGFLKS